MYKSLLIFGLSEDEKVEVDFVVSSSFLFSSLLKAGKFGLGLMGLGAKIEGLKIVHFVTKSGGFCMKI